MNKELKIEIPEGYEIDKDKSIPFEKIVFKMIENNYPKSIKEIDRRFYISPNGNVVVSQTQTKNHLSTIDKAEAFVALMQLVELRDAWNKIDEFVPDWNNGYQDKFVIIVEENRIRTYSRLTINSTLYFKTSETRDLFLKTFKDLIETAKELI